jgi:hypothetical protein
MTATKQEQRRRQPGILRQLAGLDNLTTDELKARWRALHGKEPPRFNRQFLIKRLAYRIQEVAYGKLTDDDHARMEQILDDNGYNDIGVKLGSGRAGQVDRPLPGTVLTREWKGKRHEVIVQPKGFEYRGKPYRSLTAVARAITGTSWNGLVFFGLRKTGPAKGKSNGSQ